MINIMYAVDPIKRIVKPMSGHAVTEQDHEATSLRFAFPDNIAGTGLDSTGIAVKVMYIRPDGGDPVAKTLTFYRHSGGYYLYDWNLQKGDLQKEGGLTFSLCVFAVADDAVSVKWHTVPYQIRVENTIHTDDDDSPDETITPTVAERVAVLESMIQRVASGAPIVVASMSAMTDTDQIYVLKTDGNWYYHNGSAWVAGGEYGAVATDTTLSQSGIPADAKAVGDAITEAKTDVPKIAAPEDTEVDLYVCDESGNVIAEFSNGHFSIKCFASESIGNLEDLSTEAKGTLVEAINEAAQTGVSDNIIKQSNRTEADLYICDSFGNVVAEFKDGHIITKNFDSGDYADALDNIELLLTDVSDLKTATSGIVYRNMDATDGVYASCRWHQPKTTDKQFCLLMGADVHGDAVRMNSMIEYLNAVDAFDAGIILGDIGAWESDATWYTEAISKTDKPFLTVVGNHDAAGNRSLDSTSYEYLSDFYDKFIAPNIQYADLTAAEHPDDTVYYYKDFVSYKIRLICINQYDYPPDKDGDRFVYSRGANCYSQAQITWLCNTLLSTPSDYGVIMAMHSFPAPMRVQANDNWVSSTWHYSGPADIMDHSEDGYIITEIVDAWMNGTSLSKTYGYIPTGSWTSVVVDVDFSTRGTGEFITYIGGHWHMSVMSEVYAYPNQKNYSVDCTGLPASTQGDTPRRAGTRSEDAICVLTVDRDSKIVKLVRIGAHFTKDAVDRLYGKYSYATD